jgi:malate synthase
MDHKLTLPPGMEIIANVDASAAHVLNPGSLEFLAKMVRQFSSTRDSLLAKRIDRQKEIDSGKLPNFLSSTKNIRDDKSWKVAPVPDDLQDRRTEITGPIDRKMIINALNCGAKVFMADCEDATSPTWKNLVDGQRNLHDAVMRSIDFTSVEGKKYSLNEKTATLMVRPRGWHLLEKHVLVDGEPISAGMFDFAIYFFNNARHLIERGSGPYFYLPKMESHLEGRTRNPARKHQGNGVD